MGKARLEKHPEEVSSDSSMHPVLTEHGLDKDAEKEEDIDMLAAVKHDLVSPRIVERFSSMIVDNR